MEAGADSSASSYDQAGKRAYGKAGMGNYAGQPMLGNYGLNESQEHTRASWIEDDSLDHKGEGLNQRPLIPDLIMSVVHGAACFIPGPAAPPCPLVTTLSIPSSALAIIFLTQCQ